MKLTILLLSVSLAALTSCTTSYKTGQTPDDVYYSPVRAQDENDYVKNDKEEYNDDYYEDRYLRMKVRNRNRWSDLDDWYYTEYRNRHNVYLGCCYCSNNWSPHSYWNTYYNPYYHNYVIVSPGKNTYNKPRNFNLNAYNPQQNAGTYTNTKYNSSTNSGSNNNTYTPRTNSNNNNGNRLRNIFRSETNTSSSSGSSNSSSSSSGSSSSGSSGSGSSGGSKSGSSGSTAPVRRF